METKKETVELIEAEVVDDLCSPDWDFEEKSRKQPRGMRKKDFPAFTAKVKNTILHATQLGMPLNISAQAAGVALSTVERWLQRGQVAQEQLDLYDDPEDAGLVPIDKDFAEFYLFYTKSLAIGPMRLAEIINAACEENPNLAMKWLEKQRPAEFGQRQSIEMTGKVAHAHIHGKLPEGTDLVKQLTTEEIKYLKEDIVKKKQNLLEAGKIEESDDEQ